MIGDGNAEIAGTAINEARFDFATVGANRREQADFDGFLLVRFTPAPSPSDDPLRPPF